MAFNYNVRIHFIFEYRRNDPVPQIKSKSLINDAIFFTHVLILIPLFKTPLEDKRKNDKK